MAIKNKRTSIKKSSTIEERLKKQLKEDYSNFLEEDDTDLDIAGEAEVEESPLGNEDLETVEGNEGGAPGINLGDAGDPAVDAPGSGAGETIDLNPTQEQSIDNTIDSLLTGGEAGSSDASALAGGTSDVDLDAAGIAGESEDDLDLDLHEDEDIDTIEDEMDFDTEEDIDVETEDFEDNGVSDEGYFDDSEVESLGLDLPVSAEELNAWVNDEDTLGATQDGLTQKALEQGGGEDTDDDLFKEAEGDNYAAGKEPKTNTPAPTDPMKGLKGDAKGGYDQGYEGKNTKDELQEAGEPEGFKSTSSKLEGSYSKTSDGKSKAKKIDTDPTFSKVSQTVKESIKKSKMLVKAAAAILRLKEQNAKLVMENNKLARVNGIFTAVGEQMSKNTRKNIVEAFDKCKTDKEAKDLYEKLVKGIKESRKAKLNEAVSKKQTQVKVVPGAKPEQKQKQTLTEAQRRINHLMGLDGGEGYGQWK